MNKFDSLIANQRRFAHLSVVIPVANKHNRHEFAVAWRNRYGGTIDNALKTWSTALATGDSFDRLPSIGVRH